MDARQRPTCSPEGGISPANKQGNSSDSSTPSKGEGTPNPTRKNKRKMSEPRKRTDGVSTKRYCLEDKVTEIYGDDVEDDSMMLGVHELPPNTPEPSPSSDERNNSIGTDSSSSPVLIPSSIPPQFFGGGGGGVPTLYHTPVLTNVGGIPRYTLLPGLPPGFFPPTGFMPPGLTLAQGGPAGIPPQALQGSPEEEAQADHSIIKNNNNNPIKEDSPSSCPTSVPSPSPSVSSGIDAHTPNDQGSRKQRKNYKNMTRERRIEANARERTRVHTISAAFESLRRAVPSYSYHQRLSKLAILRIACSYILSLSRLADMDYSEDQSAMAFSECVDLCTQTIQSEGRAKRRQ